MDKIWNQWKETWPQEAMAYGLLVQMLYLGLGIDSTQIAIIEETSHL